MGRIGGDGGRWHGAEFDGKEQLFCVFLIFFLFFIIFLLFYTFNFFFFNYFDGVAVVEIGNG